MTNKTLRKRKNVLIIHGWPQAVTNNHPLYIALEKNGCKIVNPYLFTDGLKLNLAEIIKYIEKETEGLNIDVVIGISMGGLVTPHLVKDYPKAKLVFIASGVRFNPHSRVFNMLLNFTETKYFPSLYNLIQHIPVQVLNYLYSNISPFEGEENELNDYKNDRDINIRFMLKLTPKKIKEILRFVKSIDNSKLLSDLNRQTLIVSGSEDNLMNGSGSDSLYKLIKSSELMVTNASHFNVLNREAIDKVVTFSTGS